LLYTHADDRRVWCLDVATRRAYVTNTWVDKTGRRLCWLTLYSAVRTSQFLLAAFLPDNAQSRVTHSTNTIAQTTSPVEVRMKTKLRPDLHRWTAAWWVIRLMHLPVISTTTALHWTSTDLRSLITYTAAAAAVVQQCIINTGNVMKFTQVKRSFVIFDTWASECPDVKNYKWRLNPVIRIMITDYVTDAIQSVVRSGSLSS